MLLLRSTRQCLFVSATSASMTKSLRRRDDPGPLCWTAQGSWSCAEWRQGHEGGERGAGRRASRERVGGWMEAQLRACGLPVCCAGVQGASWGKLLWTGLHLAALLYVAITYVESTAAR